MNYILTCVILLVFLNAHSRNRTVVLEWKFKGIEVGYDHLNRSRIYVDGKELPVSDSCRQSQWGSYRFSLSKSVHRIKVVNEAFYNGRWVEHTFGNQFGMNATCEFDLCAKEVSKVRVEFDLNKSVVSIKKFDRGGSELLPQKKKFKGRHYPLTIDWKFIQVEPGYDHASRMRVFVDDVEYGMSEQTVESKGGIFYVNIPKGQHRVRIVNQSCVNGVWQDHTIVNNYSVEAVFEKLLEVRKAIRVTLVIDLNDELTVNEWQ